MTEAMPDFVKLFNERLEAIEPLDEDHGSAYGWGRSTDSTYIIKRDCPAVIFIPYENREKLNIWVMDPKDLNPEGQTHLQAKNNLYRFYSDFAWEKALSAYIRQDVEGKLYLLMDEFQESAARGGVRSKSRQGSWIKLVEDYHIHQILGKINPAWLNDNEVAWIADIIFDTSELKDIRLQNYLLNLANQHHLTGAQYLRLRILTLGLEPTQEWLNYDQLIQEIKADSE